MKATEIIHKVNDYLYFATRKLSEWLQGVLPKLSDDWWYDCVLYKFDEEIKNGKTVTFNGDEYKSFEDLDLYWLLRVVENNIIDIINKSGFTYKNDVFDCRDLIGKMIKVRSRWAHLPYAFLDNVTIESDLGVIADFYCFLSCTNREISDIERYKIEIGNSVILNMYELVEETELKTEPSDEVELKNEVHIPEPEGSVVDSIDTSLRPVDFEDVLAEFLKYEENFKKGSKTVSNTFGGDKKYKFSELEIEAKAKGAWVKGISNCKDSIIVIRPKSNKGLVKKIEKNALSGCNNITGIIIPDTGESIQIEEGAFSGCTSLKDVYISKSVTSIGVDAFANCKSLSKVHISDIDSWCKIDFKCGLDESGNIISCSNPLIYAKKLYHDFKPVHDITISSESIKDFAFYNCESIKKIELSHAVSSIGVSAFENCGSLERLRYNNATTLVGEAAFRGCKSLSYIYLEDETAVESVALCLSIGKHAFNSCEKLVRIDVSDCVVKIGEDAFRDCVSLQEIHLPRNLESIEAWAFKNSGLNRVDIPDGVKHIGLGAFSKCKNLRTVTLPHNLEFIGERAFKDCSTLVDINLPDEIEYLYPLTFRSCSSLKKVDIPHKVDKLGDEIFFDCSSLEHIFIPEGVTIIGRNAFAWCSSLKSVCIPRSVVRIDEGAFSDCEHLENISYNASSIDSVPHGVFGSSGNKGDGIAVTIGTSVYKIPDFLFSSVSKEGSFIDKVTFESGSQCSCIGNESFRNCGSLTKISIPSTVENIGDFAFSGTGITKFVIPNSVISIGKGAFENSSLIRVNIPKSLTNIPSEAFSSCSDLLNVTFEDGSRCSGIYDMAFSDCISLLDITIPDGVKYIGDRAFDNCSELENIYYNATSAKVSIGFGIFCNVGLYAKNLTVTVGANVKKIPKYIFAVNGEYEDVCYVKAVVFEKRSRCQSIGDHAFCSCPNLYRISIPQSLTNLGDDAISPSLKECYFHGGTREFDEYISKSDFEFYDDVTVYFYSEDKPRGEGNFWHYVNGRVNIW